MEVKTFNILKHAFFQYPEPIETQVCMKVVGTKNSVRVQVKLKLFL